MEEEQEGSLQAFQIKSFLQLKTVLTPDKIPTSPFKVSQICHYAAASSAYLGMKLRLTNPIDIQINKQVLT